MELFKLLGTIAINNSEANENIDETTGKVSSFGEKLSSGLGTVGKWSAAIVSGATAATGAMIGFATSSASTADNIDKMSQKIGISRQAYQELDFICSQSGTSVDNLQLGMKTLIAAMDGAASGTEASVEKFEALGISVANADGSLRNQEEVMWETLEALQSMENQTEKARLATELFGRSGTELMPLLNGASGSIEEMKQQAHDLGLVLADDIIDNGVELTDSLDQTKRAFKAMGTQLGGSLMPIVTKLSDYIQKSLPFIQELISRLEPILVSLFEQLLPPLMDLAETLLPILFDVIEQLLPPIAEVVEALLPVIVDLIQTLLPPLVEIIQALLPVFVTLLDTLMPIFQLAIDLLKPILDLFIKLLTPILDLISKAITPLIEVAGSLINTILTPLQSIFEVIGNTVGAVLTPILEALSPVFDIISSALKPLMDLFDSFLGELLKPIIPIIETLADVVGSVLGGAFESLEPIIDSIMQIFGGLIDFITGVFTGDWDKAWNGIVSVFKGIFNLIPSIAEAVINGAIGLINGIIGGINDVSSKVGIPAIPSIPKVELPRLEEGGVLEKGQVGLLEGNGAEAVVPLENNHKWIASVARDMQAQGLGGDSEEVMELLNEILDAIKGLNVSEIIQVVPDSSGIFELVREESIKNAELGRAGIVV